jgi:ubiquinol-cytochrome c reductase cytochrome b subunit
MVRRIIDWLDHRTGIESAVKSFLYEEIPATTGWHQVFGSMALFCFMVQAFTGILLAFNYAPTPGDAYNSVRYIMTEVTGGRIIRGLHHWGASTMIVVVGLHLLQVFIWGAYKKPREATWLVGLVLLKVTLLFGLTGYLLPWDNRAYWGTVVTTQIAAKSPGAGEYLTRLMGSDGGVGVVTFARFYALHVMLLPAAMMLLVAVHVYLVRKHGVMPAPGDNAPKKKFFPEQVFRDTVAIFAMFMVLVILAVTLQAPLGRLADPTDTSYIPRPEWYFLFLFQTLKFFEGPLEVVGSHVLPGLAMLALVLLPFFDRARLDGMRQRVPAVCAAGLGLAVWCGLTIAAILSTPPELPIVAEGGAAAAWQELAPSEMAGLGVLRKENCLACHQLSGQGGKVAVELSGVSQKRNSGWLQRFLKNPQALVPGTAMPPVRIADARLNDLVAFLIRLNPQNAAGIYAAPPWASEGALVYQTQNCGACHQVNGVGMKLGPALNGAKNRRTRQWVIDHFRDPQKLSPGSTMPPYRFSERELQSITSYVMSL